jgi:hypothetical protein
VQRAQRKGLKVAHAHFTPLAHARFDLLIKEMDCLGGVRRLVRLLDPAALVVIVRHPCAVVSSRLEGLRLGAMASYREGWQETHALLCESVGTTPAFRCHAPAKGFPRPLDALRFAREAATAFRVGYAVWRVLDDRLCCLERFPAGDRPA